MEESLAKQRTSVEKQRESLQGRGFFLLSPPSLVNGSPSLLLNADCDRLPETEVTALIGKAATQTALDPALIRAVMQQESGFRSCAVSPKGAMGLMQLMPATADEFGVKDAFDPAQNVEAGARLLKQLMNRYSGEIPKVLAAYNAGSGAVDSAGGVPEIPETLDYIQRILSVLPKM
jgi:hypothetical protein